MAISKATVAKNAACNAIVDLVDTNAPGSLKIYGSILPAPSTLLTSFTLNNPAFGSASDGTAVANAITPSSATADGTASTFTVYDGNSAPIFSGTVSATGFGGDLQFNSVDFRVGTPLAITSAKFIVPA